MAEIYGDLSIGQVAKATGISVYTLRQWERRYGSPTSHKLDSGHRRYSQKELSRLRLISKVLDFGYRAHQIVPLSHDELIKIIEKQTPTSSRSLAIHHWLECVKNWDELKLFEYCSNDWNTLGPLGFVDQRVAPFLISLGESWCQKEISISQEHFFSELIQSFLSHQWRKMNLHNTGDIFILATLEQEKHHIGLHMCAVVLASLKKKVVFLGAPIPADELIQTQLQNLASSICLSFSSSYPSKQAEKDIQYLKDRLDSNCDLIIGGSGAPDSTKGAFRFSSLKHFYDWLQYERPRLK